MKEIKPKLTLDRPATYQIKVPGHLDEGWSDAFRQTPAATELGALGDQTT